MTIKQFTAPAAFALIIAIGIPAHAGGNKNKPTPVVCTPVPVKCNPTPIVCSPTPVKCDPTPVTCNPTPVKCNPTPECGPKGAVPEPASIALVGVGSLLLFPMGIRALKSRRQIG